MYAVVQLGSNQYKVKEGDVIETVRLSSAPGKTFSADKVLFFAEGEDVRVGQPFVKDVKVTFEVKAHTLDDKKVIFKSRVGKGSNTKRGHRQKLTALTVKKISA